MSLLRGTVTDNQDPLQRGRCRVWVWGMHEEQDPNLPWAETAGSTMFGLHKGVGYSGVLQVGTTVWVQFEQNDIQCPVIVGVFVGHDAESMDQISADNSDFNPDAKGDKYGQVWMFNTPAGNSFKMDDQSPRIHITTPNGFELDLDDANRKLRLGTPCGPEIVMECDGKLMITNGQAKMTFEGDTIVVDANMQVNGHVTAQGVFAPNLCYCGSPGSPANVKMKKPENKKECNPTTDKNGNPSCNTDLPPENDESSLDSKMKKLLDKAKEIYKKTNGKDMKVCETKMSAERYNCLISAGQEVPKQMVCGFGVLAIADDQSCEDANPTEDPNNLDKPVGECGGTFPALETLKSLISSGEGNYNSYNNGTANGCGAASKSTNFANMTVQELKARQASSDCSTRIFAFGKYQIIPSTFNSAVNAMGLKPSDKITNDVQEKLFYYVVKSRSRLYTYLTQGGDPSKATMDAAQCWASIGVPYDTNYNGRTVSKGQSYYAGTNNKAHTSPDSVQKALENLRSTIQQVAKEKGMSESEAFKCMAIG